MKYAALGPIAIHLPEKAETNDDLAAEHPKWDMRRIYEKTGIAVRYVAAPDECASDLAVAAARKLFAQHNVDPASIGFLLLCTQTPDYPLPTTACLVQDRLGLPTSAGALDFNLGCSGFVYGLSLADGLIRSGAANRVLLITAETYSKYIAPDDRSLRTIFSDGAAATLIEAGEQPSLFSFAFGTDGRDADTLMVNRGGARPPKDALQPRKRRRWPSRLYMDGPALVNVTLDKIPTMVDQVLSRAHQTKNDIDFFIMHQATRLMLDRLRQQMQIEEQRMPLVLKDYGNTVSSTVPIVIQHLRDNGQLKVGHKSVLVGFGVGFSWSACLWHETYRSSHATAIS